MAVLDGICVPEECANTMGIEYLSGRALCLSREAIFYSNYNTLGSVVNSIGGTLRGLYWANGGFKPSVTFYQNDSYPQAWGPTRQAFDTHSIWTLLWLPNAVKDSHFLAY